MIQLQLLPDDILRKIQTMAINNLKHQLIMEVTEKLNFNIYSKEGSEELDFDPGWDWCDYDCYGNKDDIIIQLAKLKKLDAITIKLKHTILDWLRWANNITEYQDNYTGNDTNNYRAIYDIYRSVKDNDKDTIIKELLYGIENQSRKP